MSRTTAHGRHDGTAAILAELAMPVGVLLALFLPFVFYSILSNDALRESKLFVQALAASLALFGLALTRRAEEPNEPAGAVLAASSPGAWLVKTCLALVLILVALSALANRSRWVDPFTFVALLSLLALFWSGASRNAASLASRVFFVLVAGGLLTAALAVGERFFGFFRLPITSHEKRFLATALIGNPGDVGAALVLPILLLWIALMDARSRRARLLLAAAFALCLLGMGVTESIAPLLATGFGITLYALLDPRRRLRTLVLATVLVVGAASATGVGGRGLQKLREFRDGKIGDALTQRDIGVLAAVEMIRANPFLGIGPGNFENAFVPYRLAAEERTRRRLVHLSDSAHFENAHSEPLTLAAECGVPVALVMMALALAVLGSLVHQRRREGQEVEDPPTDTIVVLLASFLVLSLGGFPLRLPVVAGPTAFVAGLAWRRLGLQGLAPRLLKSRHVPVGLGVLAVSLFVLSLLRGLAIYWQASGEVALQAAALTSGAARQLLLSEAKVNLQRSVRIRPRRPTAWLALGSANRLEGNAESAWRDTVTSHTLEERAETNFNLGLMALERGAREDAHSLFRRAVWIQPALLAKLPEAANPALVEAEIREFEANLARGGQTPSLQATKDGLLLMAE